MTNETTESVSCEKTEILANKLREAINKGVPFFNEGRADRCYDVYSESAEARSREPETCAEHKVKLREAVKEAAGKLELVNGEYISSSGYKNAAWILRKCFDEIIEDSLVQE